MMNTCKDLISIPSKSTPLEGTTTLQQSQSPRMGPVGISRSAIASQMLKAKMRAGTLKINEVQRKKFEGDCRTSDPQAEFH